MSRTKVMSTLIVLLLFAFAMQTRPCLSQTNEKEMIFVCLYVVDTPDGVLFVKNPSLYFKYASSINSTSFNHLQSATYTIQPETPKSKRCVVTLQAFYSIRVNETEFNELANAFKEYFNHGSLGTVSPLEITEGETVKFQISYGYLPNTPQSYVGKYKPEEGFAELLDSFLGLYPTIRTFYTLKDGFFETWFISYTQEMLTTDKTFDGTREVKLKTLFTNSSSIRASDNGDSTIVVAIKNPAGDKHTIEATRIEPTYTTTEDLPDEKRYIWNLDANETFDDIIITAKISTVKNNNSWEQYGPLIFFITILVLIILVIQIRRRKKRHRDRVFALSADVKKQIRNTRKDVEAISRKLVQ